MTTASTGPAVPVSRPVPVPQWWRDVAGLLAWGSGLVVVALWVHGGGVGDLRAGGPTALTTAGRLTGLLAADLMLVQVALMARIPFVERSYGLDELARRHRLIGLTSVWLLLAHLLLTVLGYAGTAAAGFWATAWSLVTTYPGMLLATAGTALVLMVVGTSVRAVRRRLRYESWHLLHLYGYLGAGLAVPHMIWTGADLRGPLASAYWWTAWGSVLAAVAVFRVAVPLLRSRRHAVVVARVVPEGPDVVSLHLRGRRLDRLPVAAGQFFVWRFLDGAGRSRGTPLSLSAAPHPEYLRVTAKVRGDATQRLAGLRPGTPVLFEGPYGRLTAAARSGRGAALIASGIGIAPIRALLEDLPFAPGEATLVHRASTEEDLVLRSEIDELAAARGVAVVHLVGPRVRGRSSWLPASHAGRDDAAVLRQLVPDVADRDVYVCGPPAWMGAVVRAAERAGVPAAQVHTERFEL